MFVSARTLANLREQRHAGASLTAIDGLVGRLTEVSGLGAQASFSVAMQWVLAAQRQQELAAWIQLGPSVPFVPDVVQTGIDLAALPFIVMPTIASALKAAEHVLRSGAFGLVVIDTGCTLGALKQKAELSMAMQSRLLGLAQKHKTAIVCLSEKSREASSFGSLVSLRVHCSRRGDEIVAEVLKDKHAGPGAVAKASVTVVDGLRPAAATQLAESPTEELAVRRDTMPSLHRGARGARPA